MVDRRSLPTRKALQAEFERAADLRAARRILVETLRAIALRREVGRPTLLVKPDRRSTPRES